jgi:hypothetical protein
MRGDNPLLSFWSTYIYQKGSGGPQKPFSWLSEGIKGVFTISTEYSEMICIPHLHILGAIPMSSWSLVRVNIV